MADRNWLLVLGLDFDPAPSNKELLAHAVDDRAKYWNVKSTKTSNVSYYRSMCDRSREIKACVLDDVQRSRLEKEAQDAVYPRLDRMIKAASNGQEVKLDKLGVVKKKIEKQVSSILDIPDWTYPLIKIRERAEAAGYKVVEEDDGFSEDAALEAYAPYADRRRWSSFKGLSEALSNLGAEDLYSLALPDMGAKAKFESNERIIAALEAFKNANSARHDQKRSDSETVFNSAKMIFGDDNSRKEYNEYLSVNPVKNELITMMCDAELSNVVSEDLFNETVANISKHIPDKEKASLIVAGCCISKNLRFQRQDDAVYCRFGHVNQAGSSRCHVCNIELEVECPRCKKKVKTISNYCDCGTPIGSALDEAAEHCEEAERHADAFDFAKARECLEYAREKWPSLAKIALVERNVAALEKRVGTLASELKTAIASQRFFEAKRILGGIRREFPSFKEPAEATIEEKVRIAGNAVAKARTAHSEDEKEILFSEALEASADCQEAFAFMQGRKPAPATNAKVRLNDDKRDVLVTWGLSPSRGALTYCVVRKEGSAPLDRADGIKIGETRLNQLHDANLIAGRQYYYSVFVDRFGAESAGCACENPIVVLAEVEDLALAPSDGAVEIRWRKPAGDALVELLLEGPDSCILAKTDKDRFLHTGLENGRTYSYRIRVIYRMQGSQSTTEGIAAEATPVDPGQAICDFHSEKDHANSSKFRFSWSEKPSAEVRIYATESRGSIPEPGSLTTLYNLDSICERAPIADQRPDSAVMVYGAEEPLYVFPVLVYGATAVVGNSCRCFNKEEIKVLGVHIANDDIVIQIEPPENAVGFVVLSRSDRFVMSVEENSKDGNQLRKSVTLRSYQKDGVLTIKNAGQRDYYISVFAMYGSPVDPVFSEPAEYLFSNRPKSRITYSIRSSNLPFMSPKATIVFKADTPNFVLPETSIVYGVNVLPIFEGDGIEVAVIPEREVNGSFSYEVSGLPKRKNLFLKALPVDGANKAYVLDAKSNAKIS